MDNFKLPKEWCVEITNETRDVLFDYWANVLDSKHWGGIKDSNHEKFKGYVTNVNKDNSYMYWGNLDSDVITFEQFKTHVLKETDTSNVRFVNKTENATHVYCATQEEWDKCADILGRTSMIAYKRLGNCIDISSPNASVKLHKVEYPIKFDTWYKQQDINKPVSKPSEPIKVFGRFAIGDIIVSLTDPKRSSRKEGNIYKVHPKSRNDRLYYNTDGSTPDSSAFRAATKVECNAFYKDITNIKDITTLVQPKTQYQWNFIAKKLGRTEDNLFVEECAIDINNGNLSYRGLSIYDNFYIISFIDWCKNNNYNPNMFSLGDIVVNAYDTVFKVEEIDGVYLRANKGVKDGWGYATCRYATETEIETYHSKAVLNADNKPLTHLTEGKSSIIKSNYDIGDKVVIKSTGSTVTNTIDGQFRTGALVGDIVTITGIIHRYGRASYDDPRYYGTNFNLRGEDIHKYIPELEPKPVDDYSSFGEPDGRFKDAVKARYNNDIIPPDVINTDHLALKFKTGDIVMVHGSQKGHTRNPAGINDGTIFKVANTYMSGDLNWVVLDNNMYIHESLVCDITDKSKALYELNGDKITSLSYLQQLAEMYKGKRLVNDDGTIKYDDAMFDSVLDSFKIKPIIEEPKGDSNKNKKDHNDIHFISCDITL